MSSANRSAAKKPQRRFQFIDNSNGTAGTNSTQVRRHVMQEYMREKRWESRAQAEGEVLDRTAQAHPRSHTSAALLPQRKATSKARTRNRNSAESQEETDVQSVFKDSQAPIIRPQPDWNQVKQTTQPVPDYGIETTATEGQIPFQAPVVKQEFHSPRRDFYLTPQAFARIADMIEPTTHTFTSSTASGISSSPNSLFSSASSTLSSSTRSLESTSPFRHGSVDPCSPLSAARTDPFNSLPLTLSRRDQELFDFYATVMPACSYGFQRRNPRAHNWYLSVFIPEAMKSPVAFQNTILVHAANTQAWVRSLPETELSIEHRARASQMLAEQFSNHPTDTSDPAISSTLSAAALEDFDPRLERRQYAWMHWNAAVRKLRDRGGPTALAQSRSLMMLINWSDYIFSGYNGLGSTFFFDHQHSISCINGAEAEAVGRAELAQQCEDFIVFLKCAEGLALVTANMQNNIVARKSQPRRYNVFRNDQPLYKLLASPNGPRYTKTGQLKQIISRLAALMTVNVAMWEYRYSTDASEEFFQELVTNIENNDLDRHISVEALLQILLSGSENPALVHPERPWLVGRLLKVAKRLSRNNWERLNDFLLHCLTLNQPLHHTMEVWQHELRAEVISAPLVSYVLPLMKE